MLIGPHHPCHCQRAQTQHAPGYEKARPHSRMTPPVEEDPTLRPRNPAKAGARPAEGAYGARPAPRRSSRCAASGADTALTFEPRARPLHAAGQDPPRAPDHQAVQEAQNRQARESEMGDILGIVMRVPEDPRLEHKGRHDWTATDLDTWVDRNRYRPLSESPNRMTEAR